jgi:O-antigen/teichoic acid export membrane protein
MNFYPEEKFSSIVHHLRDPLFRNSFFISLSRFSEIGFGFIFWLVAAHYYTIGEVGEATAIISSLGLVILLSRFGFDISQIRFMADYEREAVFNTCLWIPAVGSVIIGGLYFAFLRYATPAADFLHGYFFLFIIVAFLSSISLTISMTFMSFGKAEYRFIQNLILGIRIPLIFFLVAFGSIGIFLSFGIAYLLTAVFAAVFIVKFVSIRFKIDEKFSRDTFRFTLLSYFSTLLQTGPVLVMPLLILSISNAENAALYYIAFAFGSLIMVIPDAIGTSFFIEGSQGAPVKKGVIRSFLVTCLILVPAIIAIWFFGETILQWLGKDYAGALDLLRIIILSGFFVAVYQLFTILETVRLEPVVLFIFSLFRAILLISLSYLFLLYFGISGVAWAWMVTHGLLCIFIIWYLRKHVMNEVRNLPMLQT